MGLGSASLRVIITSIGRQYTCGLWVHDGHCRWRGTLPEDIYPIYVTNVLAVSIVNIIIVNCMSLASMGKDEKIRHIARQFIFPTRPSSIQ